MFGDMNIFKKAINLAVAAIFSITTIAQAAPFTTGTLRTVSLANTSEQAISEIARSIRTSSAGTLYNAQRRLLEEVSKGLKGSTLYDLKVDVRVIESIRNTFKITNIDSKTGREPSNPWETLVYWLNEGMIRFIVDDLSTVQARRLKKFGSISFDKNSGNYPTIEGVSSTPYYGAFKYYDENANENAKKIITVSEYKGLGDAAKKPYKPVFFIHVSSTHWDGINKPEKQASILIVS